MLSGFYTIASGIIVNQRNLETIGNNLTNIQTPGYRGERIVKSAFEQELMSRLEASGNTVLGDGIGATAVLVGK
ncbi:MAG: flagellar biosynthesis protein FlgG, partial [Clostridiales bacterium]|nr:flagellar biosynthesis protein FlgG [Clostridiales bacterium]